MSPQMAARLGLGLGFSPAEFASVAEALTDADGLASEFLTALDTICTHESKGYRDEHFTIPVGGHCTSAHLYPAHCVSFSRRPGWVIAVAASGICDGTCSRYHGCRRRTPGSHEAGTGEPDGVGIVVRVNPGIVAVLPEAPCSLYSGQVHSDVAAMRELGASELLLELDGLPASQIIEQMTQVDRW